MTKREKHEIAVVVKATLEDDCDEIRKAYKALHGGSLVGLRKYIRSEALTFWTEWNPYLDQEYLDYAWIRVGNRIINYDDFWCLVRNDLMFEKTREVS